ncbi:MAG: hypothetical protein ACXVHB_25320 [Solirubrobacteraceae bacterium]
MKDIDTPNVTRYHSPAAGENLNDTLGDPTPASLDGKPRGFTVGHAVGDPLPPSLDGKPRGYTVGHAAGDPLPPSLDGRPRGFTVGHAVGAPSTAPTEHQRPGRTPRDRANTRTRDSKPAPSKRAA